MRRVPWLILLGLVAIELLFNGCVSVPATKVCTVAGQLRAGMVCADTHSGATYDMSFDETLTFLEPTDTRGGALCQSADDWNKLKTALEKACRELGPRCTYEMKQAIMILRTRPY